MSAMSPLARPGEIGHTIGNVSNGGDVATIKEVAARAGVGLGTASRVLNDRGGTSSQARRRVLDAAEELGYVAHGPARALRSTRTRVLGLVVSDVSNPFFAELAHAAATAAQEHGYALLLANSDEDPANERAHLKTFATQRIDGLMITPTGHDAGPFASLVAERFPLVFLDREIPGLDVPSITVDNATGIQQAVNWLAQRGRRSIAYVGGPVSVTTGTERLAAFRQSMTAAGLEVDETLLAEGDFRVHSGVAAAHRILTQGAPDAFLSADGLMTLGILQALQQSQPRAGRLDLVSFDDSPWFEFTTPPISAIVNDATAIGRSGVTALIALLGGGTADSIRVPARFRARVGPEASQPAEGFEPVHEKGANDASGDRS
ncbi:LacI family transcriptional regulator [Enemella evansiae]|nr:LacI family transcriptional regulator [Enemella evansiae]